MSTNQTQAWLDDEQIQAQLDDEHMTHSGKKKKNNIQSMGNSDSMKHAGGW